MKTFKNLQRVAKEMGYKLEKKVYYNSRDYSLRWMIEIGKKPRWCLTPLPGYGFYVDGYPEHFATLNCVAEALEHADYLEEDA